MNKPAPQTRRKRPTARPGTASGAKAPPRSAPPSMGMLDDLIGFHLRCAQVALFQHFNATLGARDISAPQLGTLLLIEANPGISQSAVAEALRFDRSTLVQIIDRLETRELVVREVSAHDRRSHALRLTATGGTALGELKEMARAHERDVARALSERERQTLIDLLGRLYTKGR
jgi:DNA-binding MarR family transcriptional regulator